MPVRNKVLIIGAGASGLFAAITAAEHGAEVTVLEKEKKAGRKLLMTGNGKCNFTNIGDSSHAYHGTDRSFAAEALKAFSPQDTIKKFTELGIYTLNRNGWVYPHSETAGSVLTTLLWRCRELKVKIKCDECVQRIEKNESGFIIYTKTWQYQADKLILSCGSEASLTSGQIPLVGFELAKEMGHSLVKPLPALVPLNIKRASACKWGGVRIEAEVSLYADGLYIDKAYGQVQLTDYGISGIPVFAISGHALRLLDAGFTVCVHLDFFPELEFDSLRKLLETKQMQHADRSSVDLLVGILPERLIHAVTDRAASISSHNDEMYALAAAIKQYEVCVTGSRGFSFAQCSAGGIPTGEVNSGSCESKITPGLYITGEMLDIDGECGGWNLQFAWSTGYMAGQSAARITRQGTVRNAED